MNVHPPSHVIRRLGGYILIDVIGVDATSLFRADYNHGPDHWKHIPQRICWVHYDPLMSMGPFGVRVSCTSDKAGTHSLQDVVVVSGSMACMLDLAVVDEDGVSVGIAKITNGCIQSARHVSSIFQVSGEALPRLCGSGLQDGWMSIADTLLAYHSRNAARKRACVYITLKCSLSFLPDEIDPSSTLIDIGTNLARGLMYGSDGRDFQRLIDDAIEHNINNTTAGLQAPDWFVEAARKRLQFPSVLNMFVATVGSKARIRVVPGLTFPGREDEVVCSGSVRVVYRKNDTCTVCTARSTSPGVWFEVIGCVSASSTCYDCFDKQFGRWSRAGIFRCYAIDVTDWLNSHFVEWEHCRMLGRMPKIVGGIVHVDEDMMKVGLIGAAYRLLLDAQMRVQRRTESRLAMRKHGINLDYQEMEMRKRATSSFAGDLVLAPCASISAGNTSTNSMRVDLFTIIASSAFDQNRENAPATIRTQIDRAKYVVAVDETVPHATRKDRSSQIENLRRFMTPSVGLKYPVSGCVSRANVRSDKIKCKFMFHDGAVLDADIRTSMCMKYMGLPPGLEIIGRATPVTMARMKAEDRHLELALDKIEIPE